MPTDSFSWQQFDQIEFCVVILGCLRYPHNARRPDESDNNSKLNRIFVLFMENSLWFCLSRCGKLFNLFKWTWPTKGNGENFLISQYNSHWTPALIINTSVCVMISFVALNGKRKYANEYGINFQWKATNINCYLAMKAPVVLYSDTTVWKCFLCANYAHYASLNRFVGKCAVKWKKRKIIIDQLFAAACYQSFG